MSLRVLSPGPGLFNVQADHGLALRFIMSKRNPEKPSRLFYNPCSFAFIRGLISANVELETRNIELSQTAQPRPPHTRAAKLEHVAHSRQRHDAGKNRSFGSSQNGLPLSPACPHSRRRDALRKSHFASQEKNWDLRSASIRKTPRRICGHSPAQTQNRHLRSRLFLASAQRL